MDNVNHPQHYTQGGIETIDYLQAKLTQEQFEGYLVGNILKYISRYPHKNGVEDLRKAQWYINKLIEVTKNE
ncbi:SaV-like [uncultured Caudovirales phage]|uniref:SaV-like n=1 Tax=uncultured Caudovirales phage TaxID=2100421 RepID=A0A6J5MFG5_9CAUD|nr:SaV-like [uncultured Caudovirales phage]